MFDVLAYPTWTRVASLPTPRAFHNVAKYPEDDQQIIIVGGIGPGGVCNTKLEIYDVANDAWSDLGNDIAQGRQKFCMVDYGAKLYIIGGEE